MIFVLVIGLASAVAFLWSAFLFQKVRYAVMDTLPPEFGDPDQAYSGYPEFVLSRSTPPSLQADYLKSSLLLCFAFLGFSLDCFFLGKAIAGWILLAMFVGFAALTIKNRKIYKANCNRKMNDREEL